MPKQNDPFDPTEADEELPENGEEVELGKIDWAAVAERVDMHAKAYEKQVVRDLKKARPRGKVTSFKSVWASFCTHYHINDEHIAAAWTKVTQQEHTAAEVNTTYRAILFRRLHQEETLGYLDVFQNQAQAFFNALEKEADFKVGNPERNKIIASARAEVESTERAKSNAR